jgi:hypothetical protein
VYNELIFSIMHTYRRRSKWDVSASEVTTERNGTKSATEAAREQAAKLTAMLAAKGKLAKNVGAPLPVVSLVLLHNYFTLGSSRKYSYPTTSGILEFRLIGGLSILEFHGRGRVS